MKKILCIILILLLGVPANCAITNSNNSFEIELDQVPPGSVPKSHSGLSGGAVTAIALGSTFGGIGILSGIGYYFLKHSPGLTCGFACGEKCPYELVNIDNPDFIIKSQHSYLIKAYEYASKDKNYKYLIIPDTEIMPNTYNTVYFNLPDEFIGADFKIIQSADSENIPDTDVFFYEKEAKKIPTVSTSPAKGILIKQGKVTIKENKILSVTTNYKTSKKLDVSKGYAIIVVFEK